MPTSFNEIGNMHKFVKKSSDKFKNENQERLAVLKTRINNLINELYELILKSAYDHE